MNNLKRINADGGLLVQPMDMISLLQTIARKPRIVRADGGSTATLY